MNKATLVSVAVLLAAGVLAAGMYAADDPGVSSDHPSPAAAASPGIAGTVLETMEAGAYIYVHVQTEAGPVWAAAPRIDVSVGQRIESPEGMLMTDFSSKTLNRSFDRIYFVPYLEVEGQSAAGAGKHPPLGGRMPDPAPAIDLSGVARAEGGKTVGELFDEKEALAGQEVRVRGKAVKVLVGIMDKNWVHLQDGTASKHGVSDLVVTTDSEPETGSTLLVRGKLSIDRDFGFGYHYDVLIEDAECTPE